MAPHTAALIGRRWFAVGAAGLLGAVVFFAVFGWGYLAGTTAYSAYPGTDARFNLLGIRYFLQTGWHFPLLVVPALDPPHGVNILFTDAIPAFAIVCKLFTTVVPSAIPVITGSYTAIWHLICFVAQGVFAALCLWQLGRRRPGEVLLGSLVLLVAPWFVTRFQHAALCSHFAILWAIWLWLRQRQRGELAVAGWSGLLLLVTAIHPYLMAMVTAMYAGAVIDHARNGGARRGWRWALAALPLLAVVVGFVALGYFSSKTAQGAGGGFGTASQNLTAPLVSQFSPITGPLQRWFTFSPLHYAIEGHAYLGVVVVALLVAALASGWFHRRRLLRAAGMLTAAGLLFVYSYSNQVYLGTWHVAEIPVPGALRFVTEQLRSSGRFCWPLLYLATLAAIAYFCSLRIRFRAVIGAALVALHLVDVSGDLVFARRESRSVSPRSLEWQVWDRVIRAHDAVVTFPHVECLHRYRDGEAIWSLAEIQQVASFSATPINGTLNPRFSTHCPSAERRWLEEDLRPSTLYLVFAAVSPATYWRFAGAGMGCVHIASGIACSSRPALIAPLGPVVERSDFAVLPRMGDVVEPGDDASFVAAQGEGWSWTENTGRWTSGPVAVTYLAPGPQPPARVFHLCARTVPSPSLPAMSVVVSVNGVELGTLDLPPEAQAAPVLATLAIEPGAYDRMLATLARPDSLAELHLRIVDFERRPITVSAVELRALGLRASSFGFVELAADRCR